MYCSCSLGGGGGWLFVQQKFSPSPFVFFFDFLPYFSLWVFNGFFFCLFFFYWGGGGVGSMVNHRFSLSPLVVSLTYIPHYLYGVLIGLILGDGFLTLSQGRRNACFRFQVPQVQAVARPLLFAGNIRPAK